MHRRSIFASIFLFFLSTHITQAAENKTSEEHVHYFNMAKSKEQQSKLVEAKIREVLAHANALDAQAASLQAEAEKTTGLIKTQAQKISQAEEIENMLAKSQVTQQNAQAELLTAQVQKIRLATQRDNESMWQAIQRPDNIIQIGIALVPLVPHIIKLLKPDPEEVLKKQQIEANKLLIEKDRLNNEASEKLLELLQKRTHTSLKPEEQDLVKAYCALLKIPIQIRQSELSTEEEDDIPDEVPGAAQSV